MKRPISVMVVDDSAFMRKVLSDLLGNDPDIEVIGTARDGLDALEQLEHLNPDVILLDVEMPRMNGLRFLSEAITRKARRVIMLSALTGKGSTATMQALQEGALDFIQKPSGGISLDIETVADEIVYKIKAAAEVTDAQLMSLLAPPSPSPSVSPAPVKAAVCHKLVCIASSTGGPRALYTILGMLHPLQHSGILIVQHMPVGFTQSLAHRLNELASLTVSEARHFDRLLISHAVLAPGGKHLLVNGEGRILLNDNPPRRGLRPCADLTFNSLIQSYGERICGVVLTGMGKDGLEGCRSIKKRGGFVIAQDERSSLIYGMPRVVIENGLADRVLPLESIPEAIQEWDES